MSLEGICFKLKGDTSLGLRFSVINFSLNLNQDNTLSPTEFPSPLTLGVAKNQKIMINAVSFYKFFLHSVVDTVDPNNYLFLLQGQRTELLSHSNFLCYSEKCMCN